MDIDPIESLARQVFGNPSLRRRIADQVATPTREVRLPGFNSAAATDFYNEYPGEDHHGRVNQIDFADAMERILYQSLFPDRVTMEGHDITQVALSPAVFREQLDYSVTTPSRIAEQQEAALQERIRTNDRQVYIEILL